MPALRQIALNNNAGAFVDILATIPVSRFEAMEDEGTATQGIQVKSLLDNFATTNTFTFGSEPIQVPNFATWDHFRKLLGVPANFNPFATSATKLLSARSNGAAGTTLRFIEYE